MVRKFSAARSSITGGFASGATISPAAVRSLASGGIVSRTIVKAGGTELVVFWRMRSARQSERLHPETLVGWWPALRRDS